jgi:hypothetical protein
MMVLHANLPSTASFMEAPSSLQSVFIKKIVRLC